MGRQVANTACPARLNPMPQTLWNHRSQIPESLWLTARYLESCGTFDLYQLSNQQQIWVCYITGEVLEQKEVTTP